MKDDNKPLDLSPLVGSNATNPAEPTEDKTGGRASSRAEPVTPHSTSPTPTNSHTHKLSPRPLASAALLLAILSVAAGAWLSVHHIIQTEDGVAVIRKRYLTFDNTKVDIRQWDYQAFQANAEVTKAMTAQGYGDLVKLPPPKPTLFQTVERRVRELGSQTATVIEDASQKASASIKRAGEATAENLRRTAETTSTNLSTASDATTTWAEEITTYWLDKAL